MIKNTWFRQVVHIGEQSIVVMARPTDRYVTIQILDGPTEKVYLNLHEAKIDTLIELFARFNDWRENVWTEDT